MRLAKGSQTQEPVPIASCRPSGSSLTFTLNEMINHWRDLGRCMTWSRCRFLKYHYGCVENNIPPCNGSLRSLEFPFYKREAEE